MAADYKRTFLGNIKLFEKNTIIGEIVKNALKILPLSLTIIILALINFYKDSKIFQKTITFIFIEILFLNLIAKERLICRIFGRIC